MSITEVLLIALSLSMDAFAVALTTGITHKNAKIKEPIIMAAFFGIFQALMPFIGWAAAIKFSSNINQYNHIIAFVLLAFIGGKMIYESFKDEKENKNNFDLKTLFILALATSIDAMAVGISFAFMNNLTVLFANISFLIIGVVTFILSFIAFFIGKKFGNIFKNKAEIFGGIVLIAIGLKILIEHYT